ncbi:pirin family protein [Candidatus Clostridium stratigraminis]|uniref:Pirin family protein n=1 Tax=Candidatus Clostridium stratigraminis TaxID=3381661 RepID=A0ABW8T399_9CLOT
MKLNRTIATRTLDHADPFFLLDEFRSNDKNDYAAGFPMHPHRGIETITYMIEGSFVHRDSNGNEGNLKAGEVQWMTAGKGILHEEMPMMDKGQLWGYQLWINLPKKLKMVAPEYRHIKVTEIPVIKKDGIEVKIISGTFEGISGAVSSYYPIDYMDVRIKEGDFKKEGKGTNLIYVHTGKVKVASQGEEMEVEAGNLALIEETNDFMVSGSNSGFLYISGEPINELVARYGPFVMNTMDEILKAIDDFNNDNFNK